MSLRRRRLWMAMAGVGAMALLAGCGGSPDEVQTQGPAQATPTMAAGEPDRSAASPVDGLTAEQLKAAVTAPLTTSTRAITGPSAERVTIPGGATVWRVRIPGQFPARSARVSISVGNRVVGEGVLASDLGAITAVTTDGKGLVAGAPVSYRWEGGPMVSAGKLAVAR